MSITHRDGVMASSRRNGKTETMAMTAPCKACKNARLKDDVGFSHQPSSVSARGLPSGARLNRARAFSADRSRARKART